MAGVRVRVRVCVCVIDLRTASGTETRVTHKTGRKSVSITLYVHLLCKSKGSYATPTFLSLLDYLI